LRVATELFALSTSSEQLGAAVVSVAPAGGAAGVAAIDLAGEIAVKWEKWERRIVAFSCRAIWPAPMPAVITRLTTAIDLRCPALASANAANKVATMAAKVKRTSEAEKMAQGRNKNTDVARVVLAVSPRATTAITKIRVSSKN
jgi:hypothetical protein